MSAARRGGVRPTSLRQAIAGMIPTSPGVVAATVVSRSPLQVRAVGDEKLLLTEAMLVVPERLTDHTVAVTFTIDGGEHAGHNGGNDGGHAHAVSKAAMKIHGALLEGDTVYLRPIGDGSRYYVDDRKG